MCRTTWGGHEEKRPQHMKWKKQAQLSRCPSVPMSPQRWASSLPPPSHQACECATSDGPGQQDLRGLQSVQPASGEAETLPAKLCQPTKSGDNKWSLFSMMTLWGRENQNTMTPVSEQLESWTHTISTLVLTTTRTALCTKLFSISVYSTGLINSILSLNMQKTPNHPVFKLSILN